MKLYIATLLILLVATTHARTSSVEELLKDFVNNIMDFNVDASVDDYNDAVGSFFKSAFSIKLPLESCRDNSEDTIAQAVEAFNRFASNREPEKVFAISRDLVDIAEQLFFRTRECPELFEGFLQGFEIVTPALDDPLAFFDAFKRAATGNPFSFFSDFNTISRALSKDPVDFKAFGKASGTIFRKVLQKL